MLKRARLLCYLVLCVSLAVISIVLGAWSVRCVDRVDWVDCRCFLSVVVLGGARRLELSLCNNLMCRWGRSAQFAVCFNLCSRTCDARL